MSFIRNLAQLILSKQAAPSTTKHVSSMSAGPSLLKRPSASRGHADHDWLKSYHTFNFASWYSPDPLHASYGPLRVINEDRVDPRQGFPPHQHRDFEIFSYIVSGQIKHKDSLGGNENLKRGAIQMTSAGTGVKHSEYNGGAGEEGLHFLQIWALPTKKGLTPSYYTRHFDDAEKRDTLVKVVAPASDAGVSSEREAEGPAPIHSGLTMLASILSPAKEVKHTFGQSKGYLHLVMTHGYRTPSEAAVGAKLEVSLGDSKVELVEGDGVYLNDVKSKEVTIKASEADAEFVLFDLAE